MPEFSSTPKSQSNSLSKNNSFKAKYKNKSNRYETKDKYTYGDRQKDILNHSSIIYLHQKIIELERNVINQRRKMIDNSKKQLNRSWKSLCQILKVGESNQSQKQLTDQQKDKALTQELKEQQKILDACLSLIIKERISLQKENIQIQKISNLCLKNKFKNRYFISSIGNYNFQNKQKQKETTLNPEQRKEKQKNIKSRLKGWRDRHHFRT